MYSIYGSYDQPGVPDIELCKHVRHAAITMLYVKRFMMPDIQYHELTDHIAGTITYCMNHPQWSPGKLYEFLDHIDKHVMMSTPNVPSLKNIQYTQCISELHRTAWCFLLVLRVIERNDAKDGSQYGITGRQLRRII